jgi:hypothetical protein
MVEVQVFQKEPVLLRHDPSLVPQLSAHFQRLLLLHRIEVDQSRAEPNLVPTGGPLACPLLGPGLG